MCRLSPSRTFLGDRNRTGFLSLSMAGPEREWMELEKYMTGANVEKILFYFQVLIPYGCERCKNQRDDHFQTSLEYIFLQHWRASSQK
jgi:hypothetical protein